MKTYEIKTPTAELLILELPENGNTFDDLTFLNSETECYTLLGKPDEIQEGDAIELVENKGNYYKNYSPIHGSVQGNITFTAKESLLSAIESEIFWSNPLGKKKDFEKEYKGHLMFFANHIAKWHEAELRTFNRNRTLIFKKVTPKI